MKRVQQLKGFSSEEQNTKSPQNSNLKRNDISIAFNSAFLGFSDRKKDKKH